MRRRILRNALIVVLFSFMFADGLWSMDVRQVRITYGAGRTPLPLTVVLPRRYDGKEKLPLVFALPPGSGDAGMVEGNLGQFWIYEADARGYIVVAPEILGSSLSSRATDVVNAIFAWLDTNVAYDPARVTLTGQSNGGLGAFYVAVAEPQRFAQMIVLPGAYSGPSVDFAKLNGKRVWLLVGGLDTQWKAMSEQTEQNLKKAGALPELTVVERQGHVFRVSSKQLFDWMQK